MKDLNNRLEGDHGKLKRLTKHTLGSQSAKTAYATLSPAWIDAIGGGTEARFINRLFGLYAS